MIRYTKQVKMFLLANWISFFFFYSLLCFCFPTCIESVRICRKGKERERKRNREKGEMPHHHRRTHSGYRVKLSHLTFPSCATEKRPTKLITGKFLQTRIVNEARVRYRKLIARAPTLKILVLSSLIQPRPILYILLYHYHNNMYQSCMSSVNISANELHPQVCRFSLTS